MVCFRTYKQLKIGQKFSSSAHSGITPKNKNGTTDNAIINDEIIIEENGINVIEIGEGEDVNIFDTNLTYLRKSFFIYHLLYDSQKRTHQTFLLDIS